LAHSVKVVLVAIGGAVNRVISYIDGFNLYFGMH